MPSGKTAVVGVIGAGSFGTTMATVLARAGREVLMYARDTASVHEINDRHTNVRFFPEATLPEGVRATTKLADVCDRATLIFPMVPAKAFRSVMHSMAPHLRAEHVLVHGTKGLERETFKTMTTLIREETCVRLVGAIAGPNLAGEIMQGLPAATVVGSRFDEVIAIVSAAMGSENFLVYGNRDLAGVELGGALKNILAIASGVVDGAGLGTNTKSLLITRGVAELTRCGIHFGAEAQTFTGLSGVGDIIATCSSTLSRNYQVGFRLGRGESLKDILASMSQVAEGVDMTTIVHEYAQKNGVDMPLTAGLYALMHQGAALDVVRMEVMRSHATYEIDRPS